jgi:hypothetical protein
MVIDAPLFFFLISPPYRKNTFLVLLTPAGLIGNVLSNRQCAANMLLPGASIINFAIPQLILKAHSTKDFSAHSTFLKPYFNSDYGQISFGPSFLKRKENSLPRPDPNTYNLPSLQPLYFLSSLHL